MNKNTQVKQMGTLDSKSLVLMVVVVVVAVAVVVVVAIIEVVVVVLVTVAVVGRRREHVTINGYHHIQLSAARTEYYAVMCPCR
jgi:hypothetical protein